MKLTVAAEAHFSPKEEEVFKSFVNLLQDVVDEANGKDYDGCIDFYLTGEKFHRIPKSNIENIIDMFDVW